MIRRTAVVILQFPQQRNTCSEPAMKTLEITEETQMKTYSKNSHQMCSIKKVFLFSKIHSKMSLPESRVSILKKLQAGGLQLY